MADNDEIVNLKDEAFKIFGFIEYISNLYNESIISECDYVGLYMLIYLSVRRPKNWINGKLKFPITNENENFQLLSCNLQDHQQLLDQLGGENYLKKKLSCNDGDNSITVVSIYNELQLKGIRKNKDNLVNRSIVFWTLSKTQDRSIESHKFSTCRPFNLMFTIPTPMQVLRQQASGSRVITMFRSLEELSSKHKAMLYYMDGMQNHEKDALEFLIHDIIHMEHFTNDDIYEEQVGFFICMLNLENGNPKKFFKEHGYDEILWKELEYVISDMYVFNCSKA